MILLAAVCGFWVIDAKGLVNYYAGSCDREQDQLVVPIAAEQQPGTIPAPDPVAPDSIPTDTDTETETSTDTETLCTSDAGTGCFSEH